MKYKVWIQIEHYPETDQDYDKNREAYGDEYGNEEPDELARFDTLEEATRFASFLDMNHLEASLIGQDNDPMPEASPHPWHITHVVTPEGITDCDCNLTDAYGLQVCKCVFPYGDNITRRKNANLIAAAPELLAALQALLDAPEWERFDCVSAEFVRAQDAADDAIRKAKGQLK